MSTGFLLWEILKLVVSFISFYFYNYYKKSFKKKVFSFVFLL